MRQVRTHPRHTCSGVHESVVLLALHLLTSTLLLLTSTLLLLTSTLLLLTSTLQMPC